MIFIFLEPLDFDLVDIEDLAGEEEEEENDADVHVSGYGELDCDDLSDRELECDDLSYCELKCDDLSDRKLECDDLSDRELKCDDLSDCKLECGDGDGDALIGKEVFTYQMDNPELRHSSTPGGQQLSDPANTNSAPGPIPPEVVWHETAETVHVRVVFSCMRGDLLPGSYWFKQDAATLHLGFRESGKCGSIVA